MGADTRHFVQLPGLPISALMRFQNTHIVTHIVLVYYQSPAISTLARKEKDIVRGIMAIMITQLAHPQA